MARFPVYYNSEGKILCEACGKYESQAWAVVAGKLDGTTIEFAVCDYDHYKIANAMYGIDFANSDQVIIPVRGSFFAADDVVLGAVPLGSP